MSRRAMIGLLLGGWLLWAIPRAAQAEDWPQFRGPTGLGYTTATNLPLTWGGKEQANVAWSVDVKGEGHASPVVAGGLVIVANVSWPVKSDKEMPRHFVTAYDVKDGSERWSLEIEPGPWLRNDFRSGPGGGYAAPTPCIAGRNIYCLFGSSVLAVVDLEGKLVKRLELKPHSFDVTVGSSPIHHQGLVYVLCAMARKQDSRLIAYKAESGEVAWEQKLPTVGFGHSTPVVIDVAGKPQLVVVASGGGEANDAVQSFDPATGERLWWCHGAGEAASPAFGGGRLYFDSGRGGKGTAVDVSGKGDVTDSHIQWTIGSVPEGIGSPLIVGERVFRLHSPHVLKCWSLGDGKQLFAERLPEITSTWISPVADPTGRIYFASAGKSYVIQAGDKMEVLAINDLGDANHASAAVADGKLWLLGKKKLYCVAEKSP